MGREFWKIFPSRFHAMEEVYWAHEVGALLRGKLWEGWQATPEGIITPSGEVALHPVLVGYLARDRFGREHLHRDYGYPRALVDSLVSERARVAARPRKRR